MQELYAMYLRKSRADLELEAIDKMDTLARHEAILRELARRKGLQIGGVYKEIVSGENIASRPEMKRLLADVHKSLYRGVLVVEVIAFTDGRALSLKRSNTQIRSSLHRPRSMILTISSTKSISSSVCS